MIELIEGAPEGVFAFRAVGEVHADDYRQVLKLAAAEGYDVSETEIEHASAALRDADLSGVAGGECFGGFEHMAE